MLSRRPSTRAAGDAGSALMLMPAAVLIVVVLAAMAVDLSLHQLGERQLRALAADAANDAVGAGVDADRLRATGEVRLDPVDAEAVARRSVAAGWPSTVAPGAVTVTVDATAGSVTVTVTGTVESVFARALPHGDDGAVVRATATADLRSR